jgi:hypothetical protein
MPRGGLGDLRHLGVLSGRLGVLAGDALERFGGGLALRALGGVVGVGDRLVDGGLGEGDVDLGRELVRGGVDAGLAAGRPGGGVRSALCGEGHGAGADLRGHARPARSR